MVLIECTSEGDCGSFLKCTPLHGKPVVMSPYRSTKLRKGVISLFNLVGVSEGEILEGFCSQGVIEVNKMKTRKDGKEVFTKHSPCVPHDYDV